MFVIERLVDAFRSKEEKWRRDCEEWIDEYNYRDESDYRKMHPSITDKCKKIGKNITVFLLFIVTFTLLTGLVQAAVRAESKQSQDNCIQFAQNDHVRIQHGDYTGNNGSIMRNCAYNEFLVKIDPGQYANISNDNTYDPVNVGDKVISVHKNNLVKIETPTED